MNNKYIVFMSKDKVTLSETSSTYKILITTPVIN